MWLLNPPLVNPQESGAQERARVPVRSWMGIAVVAEIEPENIEAIRQKLRGGGAYIIGFGAPFPAVQKHDQGAGITGLCCIQYALQADSLTGIEGQCAL